MRRLRSIRALFLVSLTCLLGICSDAGEGDKVLKDGWVVEVVPVVFKDEMGSVLDPQTLTPQVEGPHIALGKAAVWMINNTVKHNGWSFTGWSKTGLDENFHPWRLHVGIISGELDVNIAYDLADKSRCTPSYRLLEEWEQQRTNSLVFGIVFTKRF